MTCIITIILIYLIPTVSMYYFTRKLYSKGGYFNGLHPNFMDLIWTFFPGVNIIALILGIMFTVDIDSVKIDLSKFFKVKK